MFHRLAARCLWLGALLWAGTAGWTDNGAERIDQDLEEVVAPDLMAHLMVENSLEFSREPGVTTHPHGGNGLSTRAAGASDLWGPIF